MYDLPDDLKHVEQNSVRVFDIIPSARINWAKICLMSQKKMGSVFSPLTRIINKFNKFNLHNNNVFFSCWSGCANSSDFY